MAARVTIAEFPAETHARAAEALTAVGFLHEGNGVFFSSTAMPDDVAVILKDGAGKDIGCGSGPQNPDPNAAIC